MAASTEIRPLEEGLWVIERTRQLGYITTAVLAKADRWNRVKAWRYLTVLTNSGWLEKQGRRYFLGPRIRSFALDMRM